MEFTNKQQTLIDQYRDSSLQNLCDSFKYWESYLESPSKEFLSTLECGKQDYYEQMVNDSKDTLRAILYLIGTFPLSERVDIPHRIFVASQNFWKNGY